MPKLIGDNEVMRRRQIAIFMVFNLKLITRKIYLIPIQSKHIQTLWHQLSYSLQLKPHWLTFLCIRDWETLFWLRFLRTFNNFAIFYSLTRWFFVLCLEFKLIQIGCNGMCQFFVAINIQINNEFVWIGAF